MITEWLIEAQKPGMLLAKVRDGCEVSLIAISHGE